MKELKDLVRLTKLQSKPAGETLARAFQDDSLFVYLIPDVVERKTLLPILFEIMVRYGIRYGEVYATSPLMEGVACWLSPGKTEMILRRIINVAGFSLIYYYIKFGDVLSRFFSYNEYAAVLHHRYANVPHWYLSPIGVDPKFQGKGYGSSLLGSMLFRIDQEHLPCFVETQSQSNVSLYEHFGFHVVEKGVIPGTTLSHWAMLREA
ncbi:GNAT family N-acetyltransferase [Candidatus Bathyarchaeota archaeon]|nr:GNAT family N-acetyltransferase [Candidatus Bathyarchaeota archaeon]